MEALAAIQEAVGIRRRLAAVNPAVHEAELAHSLHALDTMLTNSGKADEALAAIQEAVGIRRRLAAVNPAVHKADLARSLHELGYDLQALGREDQALAAAQEAVGIRRRLAAVNPAVHKADLARSLHELGCYLHVLGRGDEALAAAQEAVGIRRRLAAVNPAVHKANSALSLHTLGLRLMQAGSAVGALAPMEEAVLIRRQLALADPAEFVPALAVSLYEYGWILSQAGQHMNALAPTIEAVQIYRWLAKSNPDVYQEGLSHAEDDLRQRLQETGQANTQADIEAILQSSRQPAGISPSSLAARRRATRGVRSVSPGPPSTEASRTKGTVPVQVSPPEPRSHYLPAIVLTDALTIVVLAAVAVIIFLGRNQPSAPAIEAKMLTTNQLQVGDCLRGSNMRLNTDAVWPRLVAEVPCTDEHTAQVFYIAYWPHKLAYPGNKAIDSESHDACSKAFGQYVGISPTSSKLTVADIGPEPSSDWASGDRTLICLAYRATSSHPAGSPLYRSMKGSRY